jgi:hypothetical protein
MLMPAHRQALTCGLQYYGNLSFQQEELKDRALHMSYI